VSESALYKDAFNFKWVIVLKVKLYLK
jgi:hypothetical protein